MLPDYLKKKKKTSIDEVDSHKSQMGGRKTLHDTGDGAKEYYGYVLSTGRITRYAVYTTPQTTRRLRKMC